MRKRKHAIALATSVGFMLACALGAVAIGVRAQADAGMPADPTRPPAMAPAAGAVIDKTVRGSSAASAASSGRAAPAARSVPATGGATPATSASAPGRARR